MISVFPLRVFGAGPDPHLYYRSSQRSQVLAVFNAPNEVDDHEEHAVASATDFWFDKDCACCA